MLEQSIDQIGPRRRVLAGLLVALAMAACGGGGGAPTAVPATLTAATEAHGDAASAAITASATTAGDAATDAAAQADADAGTADALASTKLYSVVNMGQEGDELALLNERGQVAFSSFHVPAVTNSFFDGTLVHDIGSLGGGYTAMYDMNNHGEVVGISNNKEKPYPVPQAFSWTLQGGMRALAGPSRSSAYAVNDSGQIAGSFAIPGVSARAVRWNADGSITRLGPLPLSLSEARAINNAGVTTGYADVASGPIHAFVWDAAGHANDIGTLGGDLAFGGQINARGEVAGDSVNAAGADLAFFWSTAGGMVAVDASGGGIRTVAGLNERSEIAGDKAIGDQGFAYRWTAGRGVVLLQAARAVSSDVFDINNLGEMAGMVERSASDGGRRAVRWPSAASVPMDLNTQLYRAPAGLVLTAAAAINDAGAILAYSNAGLVLLVPGKHGTDAPVLGPIVGLPASVDVGQQLTLNMGFADAARGGSHTATVSWDDNCPSPPPRVSEANGVGQVNLRHRFCAAGFFSVKVKVRDANGLMTEMWRDIVVNAPTLAALSGRGTLARTPAQASANASAPARAAARSLPLRFAIWAPVGGKTLTADGASIGAAFVGLYGPFDFRSSEVETVATTGQVARVQGSGEFNGQAGYRFLIEAPISGQQLHARISHTDAVSGADVVDYDNGAPVAMATKATVATASTTSAAIGAAVIDGGLTIRN